MTDKVRVLISEEPRGTNGSLLGTCSLPLSTDLGRFCIQGIKFVKSPDERIIVSMPNHRKTFSCKSCDGYNPLDANFCNWCGKPVYTERPRSHKDRYADIVHPLDMQTRLAMEGKLLEAFYAEKGISDARTVPKT